MDVHVRRYCEGEAAHLWKLHFHTVRVVNRSDYTQAQVEAWAPVDFDPQVWATRIHALNPFVATIDSQIVGYADVQQFGYIDHFYVHHQFQRRGVGRALFAQLDAVAKIAGLRQMHANVSITARPFFESYGFVAIVEQQIPLRGQVLTNIKMVRDL
ncbi:MAG: GNAT family N-acetyltransferase [Candidatus Obscuribacterales bacterium]|nr:GNAT family N-acetyltransferase [Steroidobacteraceae bacterium]